MFRRIALIGALTLAACGPRAGTTSAADGLSAYTRALRGDDPRPLYEMLSDEQRSAIAFEAWAADWESTKVERTWRAEQLAADSAKGVRAEADVRYADGQQIHLREADKGWRLDQALVSIRTSPTAKTALSQLRVALETHDFPALLALMSKARRAAITKRLSDFQQGLGLVGEDTDELYSVSSNRSELSFAQNGVRYRIVFILEDSNWRFDELHLGPDRAAPEKQIDEKTKVDAAVRPKLTR